MNMLLTPTTEFGSSHQRWISRGVVTIRRSRRSFRIPSDGHGISSVETDLNESLLNPTFFVPRTGKDAGIELRMVPRAAWKLAITTTVVVDCFGCGFHPALGKLSSEVIIIPMFRHS